MVRVVAVVLAVVVATAAQTATEVLRLLAMLVDRDPTARATTSGLRTIAPATVLRLLRMIATARLLAISVVLRLLRRAMVLRLIARLTTRTLAPTTRRILLLPATRPLLGLTTARRILPFLLPACLRVTRMPSATRRPLLRGRVALPSCLRVARFRLSTPLALPTHRWTRMRALLRPWTGLRRPALTTRATSVVSVRATIRTLTGAPAMRMAVVPRLGALPRSCFLVCSASADFPFHAICSGPPAHERRRSLSPRRNGAPADPYARDPYAPPSNGYAPYDARGAPPPGAPYGAPPMGGRSPPRYPPPVDEYVPRR